MGGAKRIDDEVAKLTAELERLDRQTTEAAQEIAGAARARAFPYTWLQTPGESRFEEISQGWAAARVLIADLVAAVGRRIDKAMAPLEDKPQPTRWERVREYCKSASATTWMHRRAPQITSVDQALLLSDRLHALLIPHREHILARRHALESDLVELSGHRGMLAEAAAAAAEQAEQEPAGMAQRVENCLQTVQDLTAHLNLQLLEMNAALNKLTIDSERAIVLASVLVENGSEPRLCDVLNKSQLPHLAPLLDLQEADMLSSKELERRRMRTDARFDEIFAAGGKQVLANEPDDTAVMQGVGNA